VDDAHAAQALAPRQLFNNFIESIRRRADLKYSIFNFQFSVFN